MSKLLKKVRLKGNESFNFREGWLRKGMRCVDVNATLFSQNDVMEQLGVGSKMVKSIKYWLLATGLCEEKYINSGRGRALYLTEDLGEVIKECDPYFDDAFTLCVLHSNIVSNEELCMVWSLFFNEFAGTDFTREDLVAVCGEYLNKKMEAGATYSNSLFADDCSSVLRMYVSADDKENPEESLRCPLCSLGLIGKSQKNRSSYVKTAPGKDTLDKMAILYVMVKNLPEGKQSVSIDDLVAGPNNIGKVFNLSRVKVNEYLDQLRASNYISVSRTAGLDMVYLKNEMSPRDVLMLYYQKSK